MQEIDTVYSYDRMNRLTEERRVTDGDRYSYDPAGNRIRKQHYHHALNSKNHFSSDSAAAVRMIDAEETYCYNERNELTKRKTLSEMTEYQYDENGSLVREKEGSRTASYRYDLLNRQIHVTTFDGREQENLYDGEGLRAGLKENGKLSTFLYYNGEILAEWGGGKTEDSVPVRRYQRGISLFQVEDTVTGISHIYSQDEQKSTVYITRNDGAVENSYAYDAFGNVLESRENIENRIRYTGQQYDQVTGQHYLRARYYNPVIGRFTQEDTYRGDGLNLYAYCGNNPVRYYDPSGYEQEYSDDFTTESGQSRVEQVDGEAGNGVNTVGNGSLDFEGGTDVWDMTEGGGIINGREYSQHAMERIAPDTPSVRAELSRRAEALAESKGLQVGTPEYYQFYQKYVDPRNIPPSVIEDAIRNTTAVPGHTAGTFVHQTADVTVIVNDTGKVITAIPK